MKVLSIVNNKGGVGKTTSAQNIGACLHRFAKGRVLFIDLDAQASMTKCFGIDDQMVGKKNVGAFLTGEMSFEQVVQKVGVGDLLPASPDLTNKEDSIKSAPIFPFNLKIALNSVKDSYDFVLVDCPPALSGLTRVALVACDYYFVPLQAEFLSYEGLRNFLVYSNEIKMISPNVTLGGVFATRYNPNIRKRISNDLVESTKNQLGNHFLKSYIRDNISITEAQARGLDIFEYAPESNGASDYYTLTEELLKLLK